ncbi:hypothetical protein ALI144C_07975 [Actinosynnema sp. ALI-1.44]|nr:hypothetical protein ALI144C_07975 [Actinosynnema sp. ALI-1.44]
MPGEVLDVNDVALLADDQRAVDQRLACFLADKERTADSPGLRSLVVLLRECLVGGKRMRPLLLACGQRAGGELGPLTPGAVNVAGALEMFHAFALIHDDVMDDSDRRRGHATLHRLVAHRHRSHPDAARFGLSIAILVGDMALGWSHELIRTADLTAEQSAAAWQVFNAMSTDTVAGQHLDLLTAGTAATSVEQAMLITRYKTAMYTVTHPLRLGLLLADANHRQLEAGTELGTALGEAFQLRDDLLGVYGDPELTGKPTTDDLRAGKNTVLLALARRHADAQQHGLLNTLVGSPDLDADGVALVRDVFDATGARATVERMITQRRATALALLDTGVFHPVGERLLRNAVTVATARDH